MANTNPVIFVRNANKEYKKGFPVLRNFNMTVQQGTIYGLLGSSGCGKTTIFSCILGLKKLDSGEIRIFGNRSHPKECRYGYMPQNTALYERVTVEEVLLYFGRIYEMNRTDIKARTKFLLNWLHLNKYSTSLISSLSGGQQRRTSLAVAMIHEPELLILDEVTAGADPLVKEGIWQHLIEIVSKKQTTIIMSGHCLQEAKQCHTVGIMRHGHLLVEECPKKLLQDYETDSLTNVVLKLCKEDQLKSEKFLNSRASNCSLNKDKHNKIVGVNYKPRKSVDEIKFIRDERHKNATLGSHVEKILSIVTLKFTTIFRIYLYITLLILTPVLNTLLMNIVVGRDPINLTVGIVNNEFQNKDFLQFCKGRIQDSGCLSDGLSCKFLNIFNEDSINLVSLRNNEEALMMVQKGASKGFISIPPNFTDHMRDRAVQRNFIGNDTISGSTITIRLDAANILNKIYLQVTFLHYYQHFIKEIAIDCSMDPRVLELPLKYNAIYGSLYEGYTEYIQPGVIILIIFVLPLSSAILLIAEKRSGIYDRNILAGIKFYHFFLGFLISEAILIIMELALLFGTLAIFFQFTPKGSLLCILLLCLLEGLTGLSVGFLVGTICAEQFHAVILFVGLYYTMIVSSAVTWPLEGLYPWARTLCNLLPSTLPIDSLRSLMNRGWDFSHPHVYPGFAILVGWIVICYLLSAVVHLNRKK